MTDTVDTTADLLTFAVGKTGTAPQDPMGLFASFDAMRQVETEVYDRDVASLPCARSA